LISNLKTFYKLLGLSFAGAQKKFLFQAFFRVISSFADLGGIAILLSILSIALDAEKAESYWLSIQNILPFSISQNNFTSLALLACLLFFIIKNALTYYIQSLGLALAEKISLELSDKQIKVFYQRGFSYLLNNRMHNTSFKSSNHPFEFASISVRAVFTLITEIAILISFLALAFYSNTILATLLLVLTLPLSWLMYNGLSKKVSQYGKTKNKFAPQSHEKLHQLFENYIEIKVYNALNFFKSDFLLSLKNLNTVRFNQQKVGFIPKKMLEIAAVSLIIMLFLMHIYFVGDNANSIIFDLGLLGIYGYKVMPAIGQIIEALLTFKNNENSQNSLLQNLSLHSFGEKNDAKFEFTKTIALKSIGMKFKDTEILKDISLEIKKGEIIGFIGNSGAGKSTLAKIILGILKPTNGNIEIDGENTIVFDNENWLQTFGYIGQDSTLLNASVYENVCYSFNQNYQVEQIEKALKMAQLSEFIGNNIAIGEKGNLLSTGQKQRLALARALYFKKENLILDEFSSNLDSETEKPLLKTIEEINKLEKTTVILVAHKESTLAIAHVVYKLVDGFLTRIR